MISNIPKDSTIIYTDGSTLNTSQSGSGAHMLLPGRIINSSWRNPNGSSNYKAELIAIEKSLQVYNTSNCKSKHLFILSDSQSAIQAIQKCFNSLDHNLQRIAAEIDKIPSHVKLHLNWLPSHVGITGNEIADQLAKQGTSKQLDEQHEPLTASEHKSASLRRARAHWKQTQQHHWYCENTPGSTLQLELSRKEQTVLSRLKSGHLKPLEFRNGSKVYPVCSKCNSHQASPEHILQCLKLNRDCLYQMPTTVLKRLEESHLVDLV